MRDLWPYIQESAESLNTPDLDVIEVDFPDHVLAIIEADRAGYHVDFDTYMNAVLRWYMDYLDASLVWDEDL